MPEPMIENDKGERMVVRNGQWVPLSQAQQPGGIVFGQPRPAQVAQEVRADRAADREDTRLQLAISADRRAEEAAAAARMKEAAAADPNATYQERYDRVRADKDIARLEAAGEGARMGSDMMSSADSADYWLDRGAPTGPMADQRIWLGQTVGGLLGWAPGIPTGEQADELRNFSRVASSMALDQVGKLKGPLSDKDIAFLKATVADADASPRANRAAIEAQRWAGNRARSYEAALQAWTQRRGRPSALNPQGQSFDQWWGQWSSEHLPPPGVPARPPAPREASPQVRAQVRAKSDRIRRQGATDQDIMGLMQGGLGAAPALAAALATRRPSERRPAPRRQAPAPADLSTMDEKDLERIARGG